MASYTVNLREGNGHCYNAGGSLMTSNSTRYESTFAYITQQTYDSGMESYYDFLRLFTALVQTDGGLPTGERLAELVFHLNDEQRQWLQLCAEVANRLDDKSIVATITEEQFHAQKERRFGATNPEQMDLPFWIFMVQRRWNAYQGRKQFDIAFRQYMEAFSARNAREQAGEDVSNDLLPPHPGYSSATWCFDRFGMSNTRLPDGRVLFIAGEHEDYYDSDFCIYNDVIVIDHTLKVTIYGYPKEVFPPTDFHTATLVGKTQLYIIGSLGYLGERQPGHTPVYLLDTTNMQISMIETSGKSPGWISRHHAEYIPDRNAIKVVEGQVFSWRGKKQSMKANSRTYWLDLTSLTWTMGRPPSKNPKENSS